ncbi:ATP-binding protein [Herpetosiphon llansteffanensis]|uniref:ATP-binding protein n=1 Tax=Herpetosiphon llansteffanensis TaxID=2094568 RepID=UPI000D7C1AFA|nr:AAA family ATPase [Herpetosiphon llansteffanensis]
MTVALRFLGVPSILYNQQSQSLPSKAVALLGYLAATIQPQRREHLLALLWAESSDEAARKNLRNTLWTIRRSLGGEIILADDDRLRLHPDCVVDLWQLRSLAEGLVQPTVESLLQLAQGPLLDGLMLPDAPDFDLWLVTEREQVHLTVMRLFQTAISNYQKQQQWSHVLTLARAALRFDPLSESLYQAIIEAHWRQGERAEALRQYEMLTTTLQRELGIEPLPETQMLRQRILQTNPLLSSTNGHEPAKPMLATPTPEPKPVLKPIKRPAPRETPFVGRQYEQLLLNQALMRSNERGLQVVLITGEIGVGKSRLWQEWAQKLPADSTMLSMHCLESTRSLPFAPVTELFGQRLCLTRLFSGDSAVDPMWLAEVARLLPQLRGHVPNLPEPPVLPADEERRRMFEAFAQCLRAVMTNHLVIGIDDLHWADQATAEWLDYVVDRLRDLPIVIVVTYRSEEANARLQRLVVGWQRGSLVTRIDVPRLDQAETRQLLSELGYANPDDQTLLERSAGNPLFLLELCRTVDPTDVPPMLVDVLSTRLARLPERAAQIVQAAAVLDPLFSYNVLRETGGRSDEDTLDGLDGLLNAAILKEQGDSYTFSHPLIATVVRNSLSRARRTFLHRRAAQALQHEYSDHRAIAGRLLLHYREAGEVKLAASYADQALEHALSLSAPNEAVAFGQQAIELDPTPERYCRLGDALEWNSEVPAAREVYHTALTQYEAQANWLRVVAVCTKLGRTYLVVGRPEVVIEWAERGLAIYHKHKLENQLIEAELLLLLAISQRLAGYPLNVAYENIQAALEVATAQQNHSLIGRCQFELGNILAQRGEIKAAVETFALAISSTAATNEQYQIILGYNNAAYNATLIGDLVTAHSHIEAGLHLAERLALRVPLQYLYSTRGEIALAEKHWDEAEEWFERGISVAQANGNAAQVANYRANFGLVARGRGDLDQALVLMRTALSEVELLTAPFLQTQINIWLAEIWQERHDYLAANAALQRAKQAVTPEQGFLYSRVQQLQNQLGSLQPAMAQQRSI